MDRAERPFRGRADDGAETEVGGLLPGDAKQITLPNEVGRRGVARYIL